MPYLGSYTADGLAVAAVDPDGSLRLTGTVPGVADASWLALDDEFLYATNERDGGTVTVVDRKTLAVTAKRPSGGDAPTHLCVHPDGFLLVANYGSGTVAVLPIAGGEASDVVRYPDGARAHQVLVDPSGEWVLAVDIGTDSIHVHRLADGKLLPHRRITAGPGPRHLVWHPDGTRAYLVCEYAPQVITLTWDDGTLTAHGTYTTAARGNPGEGVVSADGRYLYVTNRGPNTVTTFAVVGNELLPLQAVATGGDWPRHATLDPAERALYVANQRSGTVTRLPRDPESGLLLPVAGTTSAEAVAMVLFA